MHLWGGGGQQVLPSDTCASDDVVFAFTVTASGETLVVTVEDILAARAQAIMSPLSSLVAADLSCLVLPHAIEDGRLLSRTSFESIVSSIVESATDDIFAAADKMLDEGEDTEENEETVLIKAKGALRAARAHGEVLMGIFNLLADDYSGGGDNNDEENDDDGEGEVHADLVDLLPALSLMGAGSKSSKLRDAWRLRAAAARGDAIDATAGGSAELGRLDADDFASFIAAFLAGLFCMTNAGQNAPRAVVRAVVVRAAAEAADVVFGLYGEAGDENATIAFDDFAVLYNAFAAGAEEASDDAAMILEPYGDTLLPWVELLDSSKWVLVDMPPVSAAIDNDDEDDDDNDDADAEDDVEGGIYTNDSSLDRSNAAAAAAAVAVAVEYDTDDDYNEGADQDEEDEGWRTNPDDRVADARAAAARLALEKIVQEESDYNEGADQDEEDEGWRTRPNPTPRYEEEEEEEEEDEEEEEEEEEDSEGYNEGADQDEEDEGWRTRPDPTPRDDDDNDETPQEKESTATSLSSSLLDESVAARTTQYHFLLTSGGATLSLSRADVASFAFFVRASGFDRLAIETPLRTIALHAAMSAANSRTSSQSNSGRLRLRILPGDAVDAVTTMLEAARLPGAAPLGADLVGLLGDTVDCLARAYATSDGTCDALEVSAGLVVLAAGNARKSDKLFSVWRAYVVSTGDGDAAALLMGRESFASFIRALLIAIMVFGHTKPAVSTDAHGNATVNNNNARSRLYDTATACAADVTRVTWAAIAAASGGVPIRISFDEFAHFYNQDGHRVAGFLELLDHRKWGAEGVAPRAGSASSSAVLVAKASPKTTAAAPLPLVAAAPPPPPPAAAAAASLAAVQQGTSVVARVPAPPAPAPVTSRSTVAPPLAPPPRATDRTVFTFQLPPRDAPLSLRTSDVTFMRELRSLAGFSAWRASDFSRVLLGGLLEAARTAPPPAGASASERAAAALCAARAAAGDSRAPVSLAAFHAAVRATVPSASALAPTSKRALSEALTTLFLMIEEYEVLAKESDSAGGGGGDDGSAAGDFYTGSSGGGGVIGIVGSVAGSYDKAFNEPGNVPTVPASELVTALLFLCDGSKTDKLVAAFKLADSDNAGSIGLTQLASLLRGVLVGLAGVRSRAHIDAEPSEETEALDALNETALVAASNVLRLANTKTFGKISFAEFGEYYNGGGFASIAFLELLDWRKLSSPSPPSGTLLAVAAAK